MLDSLLNDELLNLNRFAFHDELLNLNLHLFNNELLDSYQFYDSRYLNDYLRAADFWKLCA